jgi:hypothetical protein
MKTTEFQVAPGVTMITYYDRDSRAWWAYYVDAAGNQLGKAWHNASRDYLLIERNVLVWQPWMAQVTEVA